jgi:putative N6-adenine-specific DNA methylase
LISRVIAPIATFSCRHSDQLYKKARSLEWRDFIDVSDTFAIFSNVSNSAIRHSKFAALRVKDGVADYFRKASGERPNVDTRNPDLWISLFIEGETATMGIDTSGGALHRRGYRLQGVSAPMQETLAAAIVQLSGWQGEQPLYDPFCGSGTLLGEALMQYCFIPPGYFRESFGFERLPDFDRECWRRVKNDCDSKIRSLPAGLIAGSDINAAAITAARQNLMTLPGGDRVNLRHMDYRAIDAIKDSVIITNPPYGIRLGESDKMAPFYRELGDFLKQRCAGATAYIYFGERANLKHIGLRTTWRQPLVNGSLDGRLAKFELYA